MRANRIIGAACVGSILATSVVAQTTMYDGPATGWNTDTWNNQANWDNGIPSNTVDAVIPPGETPTAYGGGAGSPTPTYTGYLALSGGATMHVVDAPDVGALGTGVLMQATSKLVFVRDNWTVPVPITLMGDATLKCSESTWGHHQTKTFSQPITGAFSLTLETGNNIGFTFSASNGFNAVTMGGNRSTLRANAAGSLGVGDVTINGGTTLRIDAANVMSDTGTLHLVDVGDSDEASKIIMNAADTVGELTLDGLPYPTGTYSRIGLGSADYEVN